ncbi:hypothetical protein RhiJN_23308 [Ceratobasidium sp. AG-Ba]|nr:hypothetical protein RhiJN_23308 [Ceratobasidium sp. AG-Ba]
MSAATAIREEPFSPPPAVSAPSENWDDDFLFQAEPSPAKPPASRPRPARQAPPEKRWSSHSVSSAGGWDEELEREEAERQSSAGSSSLGPAAGAAAAPRTDLSRWAETDEDDEEDDYGLATRHEDTVSPLPVFSSNGNGNGAGPSSATSPGKRARPTSPSRSSTSTSASARSSPLMHTRQVPGSPALSLFSMSTAQQYAPSVASSTAHLRTVRSHETTSVGQFVPAQPRVPRRRLRKKSRPARPGDIAEHEDSGGAYVMREPSPPDDRDGPGLGLAMTTEEEASWSESSHHHQPPVERTPSPPPAPVAGPSSPPVRSPLLSRIGSLKTKLGRRPKVSASPPHGTTTSSPVPIPSTPARARLPRSSTTPKQRPFSPETPKQGSSWFRSASATHVHQQSSPEDGPAHGIARRKSKEPFWRGVGSFSSGRSPVEGEIDHEQTVKKAPRKSNSTTTRPPLPALPLPPNEAGSPTPPGTTRLSKGRRPMSMSGPSAPPVPVGKIIPASLGRGTGSGWASVLAEEGEKEKGGVLRSLRKFSHSRKKSQTERVPSGQSTAPASSVNTAGSRVASSSTIPSLHDWDEGNGTRRASTSVPKSASAVVLSSGREYDPSGSVFTLPLGFEERERDMERPSLTVEARSSSSRPSSPLVPTRHIPGSRPSSPLAMRRPSTPLQHQRPLTPLHQRPQTPLAGPPLVGEDWDEDVPAVPAMPTSVSQPVASPEKETIIVKEPVTPARTKALTGSAPVVFEDGVEFAIFSPESETQKEEEEDVVPEAIASGRPSLSSSSAGRTSGSLGRTSGSGSIGRTSGSLSPRSKLHRKSASLAHVKSSSEPSRMGSDLLPPIELQPPSPPQTLSGRTGEHQASLLELATPPRSGTSSKLTARLHNNSPIGQSSSLSRAATQPGGPIEPSVLRRNSLSDLKIPARISRAQSGLKSNLGMVREFAGSVEQIRRLQTLYRNLLADLKYAIENGEPLSPVLFPRGSATSATLVRVSPEDIGRVSGRLNAIDERYGLWWECADVLVELGGGGPNTREEKQTTPVPEKEPSPTTGRERAITLAGNQAAPTVEPVSKQEKWDKERNGELSPRQLQILREMLSTPNPSLLHVPLPPTNTGYLNALHPGGTASAITLPSSSASSQHAQPTSAGPGSQSVIKLPETVKSGPAPGKIRRASRAGISGIKDLLKHLNLKKPQSSEHPSRPPTRAGSQSQVNLGSKSEINLPGQSQVNLGHQSQLNLPRQSQTHLPSTRRSQGPAATSHKVSPRRPSLASIFRLNGAGGRSKSKGRAVSASHVGTATSSATEDDPDESDWDRMDSASDLDLRMKAAGTDEKDATLRGRKSGSLGSTRPPVPAIPAQFTASKSQIDLGRQTPDEASFGTGTDLATVAAGTSGAGPVRSGSNRFKNKTPTGLTQVSTAVSGVQPGLRSAPLQSPVGSGYPSAMGVEGRLALTPETIKPLLEYAREVTARLDQCVAELRELGMNDGEKLTV